MTAIWLSAISDLFINLSAGWFGVAVILPVVTKKTKFIPWALILNVVFGIVALLVSVFLRSQI